MMSELSQAVASYLPQAHRLAQSIADLPVGPLGKPWNDHVAGIIALALVEVAAEARKIAFLEARDCARKRIGGSWDVAMYFLSDELEAKGNA